VTGGLWGVVGERDPSVSCVTPSVATPEVVRRLHRTAARRTRSDAALIGPSSSSTVSRHSTTLATTPCRRT
jgi:hypothetical protein